MEKDLLRRGDVIKEDKKGGMINIYMYKTGKNKLIKT